MSAKDKAPEVAATKSASEDIQVHQSPQMSVAKASSIPGPKKRAATEKVPEPEGDGSGLGQRSKDTQQLAGAAAAARRLALRWNESELVPSPGASIHIAARANTPGYYEQLKQTCFAVDQLPNVSIRPMYGDNVDRTETLFSLGEGQAQVEAKDLGAEDGTVLGLDVAVRLTGTHLRAQIREKISDISVSDAVTAAQLTQLQSLFSSLETVLRVEQGLDLAEKEMVKKRVESLETPEDRHRDRDYDRRSRSSRSRSRSPAVGSKRAKVRFQLGSTVLSVLGIPPSVPASRERERSRTRSRSRSRSNVGRNSYEGSTDAEAAGGGSAESQAVAVAGGEDPGSDDLPVWKKAVAIAAIAVVAVVALVPWLLYVGVQKLLGDEDIDIDPRKSRARSYNRAARRDEYQRRRGFPVRLFAALVGGASLIVPMVVMSLHPDQTKSLVTTSLFILLFAVLIAWRTSIKPWEVMTSTAAYAAVLVVFTGVSGG